MISLFLSKPDSSDWGDENTARDMISFLHRLESIIWSALTSGGRYEARLWLCETISRIRSITPRDQCKLFLGLLRSEPPKKDVAAQLLRLIFQKCPKKAGPVIAKKSYMLEEFFKGNPSRILEWFDNFAAASESGHKKGARALSQYAFINRDTCWEELEWKGRHGQSPAVVATKPHYFHDLDVVQTVENFLEYVPEFWSSVEFADSLKDGEICLIDQQHFVDQFVQLMYKENSADIWAFIEEFLMEENFSFLSQRLLIFLDENGLLVFLKYLHPYICGGVRDKEFQYPSFWLEYLLSTCIDSIILDELLLLNSVITHGRKLVHLIGEEELEAEKASLEELMATAVTFSDTDHWALMEKCIKMKQKEAIKLIGLQSWALHYCLSKECKSQQSCISLFVRNGIRFRKVDDYSLVQSDGPPKLGGLNIDDDSAGGDRKKRKRHRKTRKMRKYSQDGGNGDELVEFGALKGWEGIESGGTNWLLSTDDYSCMWNSADLPEYLSRHCFSTWMMWACSKW